MMAFDLGPVAPASACSGELQFAGLSAEADSGKLKLAPR
jgi:hypothetical protein